MRIANAPARHDERPAGAAHQLCGAGQGVLVDLGGDDSYSVRAASPGLAAVLGAPEGGSTPLVSQAAALADSLGVLADLAGDDTYSSGPGTWSQAAGIAGVALLLDLEGQDRYEAHDAAQGYAQAALRILQAYDEYEFQAISHASSRLQQAPIFVEESSRLTITDILAKSRRLQAERGPVADLDFVERRLPEPVVEGADPPAQQQRRETGHHRRHRSARRRRCAGAPGAPASGGSA